MTLREQILTIVELYNGIDTVRLASKLFGIISPEITIHSISGELADLVGEGELIRLPVMHKQHVKLLYFTKDTEFFGRQGEMNAKSTNEGSNAKEQANVARKSHNDG